jgi:hypothetical protein
VQPCAQGGLVKPPAPLVAATAVQTHR